MRITRIGIFMVALCLLALPVAAQQFTQVVTSSEVLALTGRADPDLEELAVGPTGNIYVIDEDEADNDRVLRYDSNGMNGVLITTEGDIVTAINAVSNGTPSFDFSINGIGIATDGDIILTNGDGSGPESVVSVTDAAAGAITVVSTAVSPAASPIEGATSSTVVGNTVFVATHGAFGGASGEAILTVDTNAGGPAASATVIIDEASILAITGLTAINTRLGPLAPGGLGILIADSASSNTSDDILTAATNGSGLVLFLSAASVEAAIGAADVGYVGMAEDSAGDVWLGNAFGSGNGDNGVIQIDDAATPVVHVYPQSQIEGDLGIPGGFTSCEGAGYDATNNRVVFANGSGGAEGVIAVAETSVPVELSVFSSD